MNVRSQFLVVTDGSDSVPDQLRRMMAWETIGGLAVHWRCAEEPQEPVRLLQKNPVAASVSSITASSVRSGL